MVEIEIKPVEELPPLENNTSVPPFEVDANTYNNISYDEFFNNHMRKNVPCIVKNVGSEWVATKKWVKDNKIDFDYLSNKYGNLIVPVSDCKNITFDYQPKKDMKFNDYITYWKSGETNRLLYLKDWHLRKCNIMDRFYTVPTIFASDWLNEYAQDKHTDDFMFVYMGPAGSWTPIHADVYNSFSWSVNVTGRKKWLLFPPGEEVKLMDSFKHVIPRFEPEKFKDKKVTYYEIIQGKGDAIFVPSGWYHQVENEVDTISINHNWVNGTNIMNMWEALVKMLVTVQKEINELKDADEFPSLCQKMLKSLYGIDFNGFQQLIIHIGHKRVKHLKIGASVAFDNHTPGKNHCMYDLRSIDSVMKRMIKHPFFGKGEYTLTEKFIKLMNHTSYLVN